MKKRVIVMPSIGDRGWVEYSSRTFLPYAKKCGADFFIERSIPDNFDFPDLPDRPGRSHKKIFALKSFLIWKYLGELGYEQILIVDDSCCVMGEAPSIFGRVPIGTCGFTTTSSKHAHRSFADIEKFIEKNDETPVEYDDRKYMNSGVMVYDQTMLHAFNPDEIFRCSSLLYSDYPHQTLSYYLLMRHEIPMKAVSKNFNRMPNSSGENRREMLDPEPYIDDAFIHHFTGGYKYRDTLIPKMAELILARQTVS
ncbi:hypothetical protein [Kushneria sp. EE4]